jgi:hypothetical protein
MKEFGRSRRSRRPVMLSIALVVAPILSATLLAGSPQTAGAQSQTLSQYRQWMVEAKAKHPYPQSVDKMYRVMMCESSGNPNARGGGGAWLGLFQYAPRTWRGSWNPYRNSSIYDARAQIFATARAWSVGMQNHWSCY